MEVKVTIGFNQETLSLIESFVSSFGGATKTKKTTVATNGAATNGAASNGTAKAEPVKEEEPKQTAENSVTDKDITIEQVRAAVQTKAQAGNRDKIKSLLAEFNVAKVTELQPTDYSPFLEKVNAL
jgi:hypothetical protein